MQCMKALEEQEMGCPNARSRVMYEYRALEAGSLEAASECERKGRVEIVRLYEIPTGFCDLRELGGRYLS